MFFDVFIGIISLAVGQNSKQLPVPSMSNGKGQNI